MKPKTCILFDIDGTLIHTHGAGRAAFARAVCETLNVEDDLASISFAGATDLDLFQQLCSKHGVTCTSERQSQFFHLLEHYLGATLRAQNTLLYPGVVELLDALSQVSSVLLGLLTGNAEKCARIKLETHALNGYFSFGGYGHEFAIRGDIAKKAKERALRLAGHDEMNFFVIGDTPKDVLAAQTIGATCIAVATGSYSQEALREAGAAFVVEDLSDTKQLAGTLKTLEQTPEPSEQLAEGFRALEERPYTSLG